MTLTCVSSRDPGWCHCSTSWSWRQLSLGDQVSSQRILQPHPHGCICVLRHSFLPFFPIGGLWAILSMTGLTAGSAAGRERRKGLLIGAGMGQRLSPCISKDSGRGETWAVVLLWKDQLPPVTRAPDLTPFYLLTLVFPYTGA